MAGNYGIEQLGHDLLFALGQFGDGVELLFDAGGWAAPRSSFGQRSRCRTGIIAHQHIDGGLEDARQPWESWSGKIEQCDNWIFCLTAAILVA